MGALIKIFLGVIAMFAAIVVALILSVYFSPDLQRRLVLRGLESGFGEDVRLDYFSFRLEEIELRGLHIGSPEESLDLEHLLARFDIWNLTNDVPEIESVIIKGFDLDIAAQGGRSLGAKYSKSATVDSPARTTHPQKQDFTGLPIIIGEIAIDGRIKLPANREISINYSLKDLAPNTLASTNARVFISSHEPGQPYQDAEILFSGNLQQSAGGFLENAEGELVIRLRDAADAPWLETRSKSQFSGTPEGFSASIKGIGLAALSRISLCNLARPLSSGGMDFEMQGRMGSPNVVEARLSITNLRPQGYTGPAYSLNIEPVLTSPQDSETASLTAVAQLSGPTTTTHATLSAQLDASDPELFRFDARVEADAMNTDDWQPLLAILPQAEAVAPERDPTPDTAAPWLGLDGTVQATLGRLQSSGKVLTDLSVEAAVESGRLVSAKFSGQSNGTPINASGRIEFDPQNPSTPYRLESTLQVAGLNVTPLVATPGSSLPPILEGIFDIQGEVSSTAPNLDFLPDNLTGDLQLDSAGAGIFRPLGENTSVAQGVSGLLGALTGSVRELGWIQMVIDQLEEIPYRKMTFSLSRDQNLNIVLNELDLVSRETRIRGNGLIRHQTGVDLVNLPMDLQFQIFAKGRLAEALQTGKQLRSNQPDELGFLPGPPLPIRGSLGDPESLLVNLLMEGGAQLLPGLLRGQ